MKGNYAELGGKLVKALGLPDCTTCILFEMHAGEFPVVTAKWLIQDENFEEFIEVIGQGELYLNSVKRVPVWDLVKFCQTGDGYVRN